MRQYILGVPRSIKFVVVGIKLVLISVPLKSLVPPPLLINDQLVPFMLVIPLKSCINALCQIFVEVPRLLLMSLTICGIICITLAISPLTLILLALIFDIISVPVNIGLLLFALLFDKSKSLVCIPLVTPLRYDNSVEVTFPILVVFGNVTVPVNVGLARFAFASNRFIKLESPLPNETSFILFSILILLFVFVVPFIRALINNNNNEYYNYYYY